MGGRSGSGKRSGSWRIDPRPRQHSKVKAASGSSMKSKFPNRSDVRVHAITLAVCTAVIYGFLLSTPTLLDRAGQIKGTDFLQYYVLGSVALRGPASTLYDHLALINRSVSLVPESAGVSYLPIYGPQVSLFFAPFAMF